MIDFNHELNLHHVSIKYSPHRLKQQQPPIFKYLISSSLQSSLFFGKFEQSAASKIQEYYICN